MSRRCEHPRTPVGASLLAIAVVQLHRRWTSTVFVLLCFALLCFAFDLGRPINHAGRTQALRSGQPGMDAGLAALGQGWPFAAAHGAMPAFGHAEPKRGTKWWGKAFLVTFGALPKVTRCKSGTLSRRYRSNGYTHRPQALFPFISHWPKKPQPANQATHHQRSYRGDATASAPSIAAPRSSCTP